MTALRAIISRARRETVLLISFAAALVTLFFVHPSFDMARHIDWKVLACLFCLMSAVGGAKNAGVFTVAASRLVRLSGSTRALSAMLVFVTFLSSMAITNDVALITFIPLALIVLSGTPRPMTRILTVVLQTIAANIGSSLTPIGNPQNLYIFSRYQLSIARFVSETAGIVVFGGILISICLVLIDNTPVEYRIPVDSAPVDIPRATAFGSLFVVSVLVVFGVLPFMPVSILAAVTVMVLDRRLARTLDYGLLLTFVCFFVCTGNLGDIPRVSSFLTSVAERQALATGILASQLISNVPAAILLSAYVTDAGDLVRAVSVGGLGTLIASLASVISFKYFARERPEETLRYLTVFTILNFLFLGILWVFARYWY